MPITIILEDGTGVSEANSYVDPAGAVATGYFEAHLHAAGWHAATVDQRKASVVQATRALDYLMDWKGRRVEQAQARQWPRIEVYAEGFIVESDEVPIRVIQATLEMAMALLERDRLADTAATQGVTELKLGQGALEIQLTNDPQTNLRAIPDQVRRLLAPFASASGSTMRRVYRG